MFTICLSVVFAAPKISAKCFPNGTAYFVLEKRSNIFLYKNVNMWNLRGNCVDYQNGGNVVQRSKVQYYC